MQKVYTNISLMATPAEDEHLVHKKYVDDTVEKRIQEVVAAIAAQNPGLSLEGVIKVSAEEANE